MVLKEYKINTSDGYPISVSKFDLGDPSAKIILICSATGVGQYFYSNFAKNLCEKGFTVYTYDYRGIGKSRPKKIQGFQANIIDWATKDFQAMTDHIQMENPESTKYLIGHSIGGVFIGLTKACKSYSAIITFCAQYGYWKYFENRNKPLMLWFFYVVIPVLTKTLGYFPSGVKKLGDPLPTGVVKDWRTLGLHPKSQLALTEETGNYYKEIDMPVLAISVEDDFIASKKAVDKFAFGLLINAKVYRKHILLSDAKAKSIGHLNFFRRRHKETLWDIPTNWLASLVGSQLPAQ